MTLINSQNLVGQKSFPAISIILPIQPQYPKFKDNRERIIQLMKDAELMVKEKYSKQRTEMLMNKLHRVVNSIDFSLLSEGLIIYITDKSEKVIELPFPVTEKVIVDDSFEVRDLIYSAKKNTSYLLTTISQNRVRTFLGYGSILVPVKYSGMPANTKDVTNEHSFPGWDYLDTKAYDEKNIHNFLRFIDDVIDKELKRAELPVIILADKKLIGYLKHHSKNSKRIMGYVEGNFDHKSLKDIAKAVEPVLDAMGNKKQEQALIDLAGAVNKDNYAAGISEVWRAATEARGRLLLVEKDYRQPARYDDNSYTITIDQDPVDHHHAIADAVDDVMELVLKNNGDIVFVDNGKLNAYQHIALVTRY